MKKNWWIILIALITPIFIAALSRVPIFQYSPGNFNSWIGYWGSYLGAIIGASVVYFVSKMQIEAQNQLQLDAIDKENKITLDREMEQYYFRLEVEKLEDFFNEIDLFNRIVTNSYNDFVQYLVNSEALYSERDKLNEEQTERFTTEVRIKRMDLYKWINEGFSNISILKRLSLYVDDSKTVIMDIETEFESYITEVKTAFWNKYSYEQYFIAEGAGNDDALIESKRVINQLLNYLAVDILQPKLQAKINAMKNINMK